MPIKFFKILIKTLLLLVLVAILIGLTLPQNYSVNKNIQITGFIKDIRTAYEKGTVFIAPMFIGSGLQNKLLEAMSMKLPCITTELANKSLNATENEIIIANNEKEFAKHCIELFNNKEKTLNLIENGYKFVKSKFDWKKSTEEINKLIKS